MNTIQLLLDMKRDAQKIQEEDAAFVEFALLGGILLAIAGVPINEVEKEIHKFEALRQEWRLKMLTLLRQLYRRDELQAEAQKLGEGEKWNNVLKLVDEKINQLTNQVLLAEDAPTLSLLTNADTKAALTTEFPTENL